MFELVAITSLLSLALAVDYLTAGGDNDDPVLDTVLAQEQIRFDGTEAREHVTGNALDNIFLADDDDDLIGGLDGDDLLDGGAGNDRLFGGGGDDTAIGGTGDDRIFLGDDDDTTAPSVADGQDAGDDFIRGGDGADTLIDTRGSNEIFGDLGRDRIVTIDGLAADGTVDQDEAGTADTVDGGFGDDTLFGDAGDVLTGGAGQDRFVIAAPSTATGAPAVVTDFDLRQDLLSIVYLQDTPTSSDVSFTYDRTTQRVLATIDNQEVATLEGLTAADIPFIATFVSTLPELMALTA